MKNKKLFLSLKLIIAVVFLVVSFAFSQTKIEWKEFISEQELTEEISQFKQKGKEVKENKELLDISDQFLEESEKINKDWEEKYFQLINQVHTANDNYALFKSLRNNISYLEKSLKQINENIDSLETIYKNRLKAIPTSYLILSKVPISTEESKNSVTRKLMDSTKKFIADTYSAAMVFSETEVANYKIVTDLIEVVEGGRVESFETDPIWFVTEEENFYLLQKYRIYPELKDEKQIKSAKENKETYDKDGFFNIKNIDDINLPAYWIKNNDYKKQIETFIADVKEENKKTAKKLSDINLEYINASQQLNTKKSQIENELKAKEEEFNNLSNYGKIDFEKELNDAENGLNTHVSSREILVFTILSELEQPGSSPEEQFKELISQAYTNLINRATSLKSYKFYRVVNHTLESYKAEEFYDKVNVIFYSMPLRRRTYREEEGGLARLGVILALKVKFASSSETASTKNYSSKENINGEIIYASNKNGNYAIYKLNLTTNKEEKLTNNKDDNYYPQVSLNGKIVYTAKIDGQEEIFITNTDGKNNKRLTNNKADDWQPFYSSELNKIIFTSYRDKNAEIYIMDIDGENQKRLTENNYEDLSAVISPDGDEIAFCSNRDGNFEIYTMDTDGTNQTRLTHSSSDDWSPTYSPDGNKIAFSSKRDGISQIYIMDINGKHLKRITSNEYNDWSPTFSPDGNYIAFHSDRNGQGAIYIINLKTSVETEIVKNAFENWSPSWK